MSEFAGSRKGWRPAIDVLVFAAMMLATILYAPFGIPPLKALAILLALLYFAADWLAWAGRLDVARAETVRWALIGIAIGAFLVVPMISMMQVRWRFAPWWAHDGLIQTEIAVDYLLAGRNPYAESYADTLMALVPDPRPGENPALESLAYLPMTLLLPLPFQAAGGALWGWFDQRLVTLSVLALIVVLCVQLPGRADLRRIALILLTVNPVSALEIASGYNDVFLLACFLGMAWAMCHEKQFLVAVFYTIACLFKQPAWFAAPFVLLWFGGRGPLLRRLRQALLPSALAAGLFALLLLPWLLWDAEAFMADIWFFNTADVEVPISGLGFAGLLANNGLLDPFAQFPFMLLRLGIGLPVMALLFWQQWRRNEPAVVILNAAIAYLVLAFFGRFFYTNYLNSIIFLIAVSAALNSASVLASLQPKDPTQHAT